MRTFRTDRILDAITRDRDLRECWDRSADSPAAAQALAAVTISETGALCPLARRSPRPGEDRLSLDLLFLIGAVAAPYRWTSEVNWVVSDQKCCLFPQSTTNAAR